MIVPKNFAIYVEGEKMPTLVFSGAQKKRGKR
jgi:hypothetical protein